MSERSFRETDSLFGGLDRHVIGKKSLIEEPYTDREEGVSYESIILNTMDDGLEIELCLWTDSETGLSLWDVSTDRQKFDESGHTDFEAYLREKGGILENVCDRFGKYEYLGPIGRSDVYRVQFHIIDEG